MDKGTVMIERIRGRHPTECLLHIIHRAADGHLSSTCHGLSNDMKVRMKYYEAG
jgi:hypothetical protein